MAEHTIHFEELPPYLREFLYYLTNIKGRSRLTVYNYYIDLRLFLRYLRVHKERIKLDDPNDLSNIAIDDLPFEFINHITLMDVHEYLYYTLNGRDNDAKARARKVCSIRMFFKYLESNHYPLTENPVKDLQSPRMKKTLPKHLSLDNAKLLLQATEGTFQARDYCMLTLFLNCGMRLNELVSIDLHDIQGDQLLLHGKGNKERMVYLNQACLEAIDRYQKHKASFFQKTIDGKAVAVPYDQKALFLSSRGSRISGRQVENIVKKCLERAGMGGLGYSPHKLRHTAATLLYQHGGVDVRVLQNILGHENLGTTQIYTHVSNQQIETAMKQNPLAQMKPTNTKENKEE